MAILDGLDQLDWSKLHHAYGPATDVPELLKALVDPDAASSRLQKSARVDGRTVRERVLQELWGNVYHQGSVWPASAKTIPFFVEILRDGPRDAGLRRFVLSYLSHLAIGYPDDLFPRRVDPNADFKAADGYDDDGSEPEYDDSRRVVSWRRDCYLAVERATADLVCFVDARDQETSLEAIGAVSWFPRQRETTGPTLLHVARLADGLRSGTAIVAAAHLDLPGVIDLALELCASDDHLLSVHGACAAILCGTTAPPRGVSAILTSRLGDLADIRTPLAGTVGILVARCVALLKQQDEAIDALIRQLMTTIDARAALSVAASLLDVILGEAQAPRSAADLTIAQARALYAIADHGPFLIDRMSFGNFILLLSSRGLPSSRDGLAAWLAA